MSDYIVDIEKLLDSADELPDGVTKVAVLEEAIDLADHHQDVKLGYRARKMMLSACLDAGMPDVMLVAYSWCLAQCDRDPGKFSLSSILWEYRWVVSEMPTFPQITKQQILDGFADITRRYEAAGSTMRAIHLLNVNLSISLKDRERATQAITNWRNADRDSYSDDAETERAFQADYYFFLEDYEQGIKLCDPVIRGKKQSDHFFGSDCADLLYPLLKTSRPDLAAKCHKQGYRYVAWNPRYVDCCGDHLEYVALVDNWSRACRLIEKHLPVALKVCKPNDRMAFLRAVYVFARRYLLQGTTEVKLNLPKDLPVVATSGRCDLAELAKWCHADVADWSAKYDARNGNDYYIKRLSRCDSDAQMVQTPLAPGE